MVEAAATEPPSAFHRRNGGAAPRLAISWRSFGRSSSSGLTLRLGRRRMRWPPGRAV